MKPVYFEGHNMVLGENQPQYQPLPVFKSDTKEGQMVQCWELSDDEIAHLIKTRRLWVSQMTFGGPLQPISVSVAPLVWITEPNGDVRAPDSEELISMDKEKGESEDGHTCDPKKWEELIEENNRRNGYIKEEKDSSSLTDTMINCDLNSMGGSDAH